MTGLATGTAQIENDRVRVTRWDFNPGDETGVHIHEMDYVIVPVLDGNLKIIDPEGNESITELKAGVTYFREKGVHHNVINANEFDYSFIEVELK